MRLTSAELSEDGVKLTFEQGDDKVIKLALISDCAIKVSSGPLDAQAAYQLVRKAREAVRDFAFKKYGADEWKQHVPWGKFWGPELSEEEQEIIDKAVKLLREQAESRR
jgi:hypothetical protein